MIMHVVVIVVKMRMVMVRMTVMRVAMPGVFARLLPETNGSNHGDHHEGDATPQDVGMEPFRQHRVQYVPVG